MRLNQTLPFGQAQDRSWPKESERRMCSHFDMTSTFAIQAARAPTSAALPRNLCGHVADFLEI